MLSGSELAPVHDPSHVRNSRVTTKKKGAAAVDLVPTLFEMTKILMKIRCSIDRSGIAGELEPEIGALEAAIMKMTVDVNQIRRKAR